MNNVSLVVCDSRHLPSGMMLPLSVHYVQTQVFEIQSRLSIPAKKRVWKSIVKSKIGGQARVLLQTCGEDFGLLKMKNEVRSGDPTNVEGKAAKRYWTSLFGTSFKRNFDAKDENAMLNYGYALMRGIVARGLCASGLHPSLGIHHHHRANPFALADDFIEPLRPLIDLAVWKWSRENDISLGLTREGKKYLIFEFTDKYNIQGQYKTLFTGVNQMASSFVKVCKGDQLDISIPSIF